MGWGRLGYRQRIDTGLEGRGGGSNPQTRKPTEAVRHRVGLRGRTRHGEASKGWRDCGLAGGEGEEADQTSEGNRGDAEQSNRS